MSTIHIAKDFSPTPGGRFEKDGPASGEEFRKSLLEPLFVDPQNLEYVTVILDGASGYATSFLEEAFGGLVRKYEALRVEDYIKFISEDEPLLADEVSQYMSDARSQYG